MGVLDYLMEFDIGFWIAAVIPAVICVISVKERNLRRSEISVLLFLGLFLLPILLGELFEYGARREVREFIDACRADATVKVNGKSLDQSASILSLLAQVRPIQFHGSHETTKIKVDITTPHGELALELGRDSTYSQEYWVFYPKYRYSLYNRIGGVVTDMFDGIKD